MIVEAFLRAKHAVQNWLWPDLHIGFSHHYLKLKSQPFGVLVSARRIPETCVLPEEFIRYDTAYRKPDGSLHYATDVLEPGPMLMLLFIGTFCIPFTTVRSDTPEHRRRFERNVGKLFQFNFKTEA